MKRITLSWRFLYGGAVKLGAAMVSCEERAAVRRRTLDNLATTDWLGDVVVAIDDGAHTDRIARIDATWRRAIDLGVESDADVLLLMEDDLDFNRRLRANILSWPRLDGVDRHRPFFGSLYNPGIYALHPRPEQRYDIMHPNACWGAQALLVSRWLAIYLLEHWHEERGEPDFRMPRLASRFVPIYYHRPSLVQHVGDVSTWGGIRHQAAEFDRGWIP